MKNSIPELANESKAHNTRNKTAKTLMNISIENNRRTLKDQNKQHLEPQNKLY